MIVQYLTEQALGCSPYNSERHAKTTEMPSTILNSWHRETDQRTDGWMDGRMKAATEERRKNAECLFVFNDGSGI